MRKQKHVEFANLPDLLNKLESSDNYKTFMVNTDHVSIGDIHIRRYFNIDPENTSEQYEIFAGDREYILLPNNKVWERSNHNLINKPTQMACSADDAEHMWYQTANIYQDIINKNFKRFILRQPKRELYLILIASIVGGISANVTRDIIERSDKKHDKAQSTQEIRIDTTNTQINPIDTVMFHRASQIEK